VRGKRHNFNTHGDTGHAGANGDRKVGLARSLSKMGICSRSQAAEVIQAGRVRLNGVVKRNPEAPVHFGVDRIEVDGRVCVAAEKVYWMLNKPRGAVTTAADEKGRQTVYDHLQLAGSHRGGGSPAGDAMPWIAPVGRLDKASEGLLLLTNDSQWGAQVLAPATHLEKTYHVQIGKVADDELLAALRRGMASDGELLGVKSVARLRSGDKNSWLEIVLDEGKNRQIRRMLEALGVEVMRLVRVAIGPLALGTLAKGASRALTTAEKAALDRTLSRR
jgi:23S rRNA pseudouridine2605 synthase